MEEVAKISFCIYNTEMIIFYVTFEFRKIWLK